MEKLKYLSTEQYTEGIIVEVTDGAVAIDLKGRLGYFKMPRRMIITDWPLEVGMEVGFMMSYPEVLSGEIDEDYKKNTDRKIEQEAENEFDSN